MPRTAPWLALLPLLLAGVAAAEIYRWTDAQGNLHFTEDLSQVPPDQREQAKRPASTSGGLQRFAPPERVTSQRAPAARGVIQIPFQRQGTVMWVEAVVNDRHRVPFLIDTGASGVSLPASVAASIGIPVRPDTPRVTVSTANGLVRFPVVELDSVEVGGARVERLEATINPTMDIGLLGGSFFNNYKYAVDTAASVITLVPNEGVRAGEAADQWRDRFQKLRDSIGRLEAYLAQNEITRPNERIELETRLAGFREELRLLEIEANHAGVPKSWRN